MTDVIRYHVHMDINLSAIEHAAAEAMRKRTRGGGPIDLPPNAIGDVVITKEPGG